MEQFAVPFSYTRTPAALVPRLEMHGMLRMEPGGPALGSREERDPSRVNEARPRAAGGAADVPTPA